MPPAPEARLSGDLVPTAVNASAIVATSAPASIASAAESRALQGFGSALFDLIDSREPELKVEPPGRKIFQLYAIAFAPWSRKQRFGYDELVAKYIGLWSVLEQRDAQRYSAQALLGLRLLMSGRLKTASQIFLEIEFQTSTAVALSYVMRGIGYFLWWMVMLSFAILY